MKTFRLKLYDIVDSFLVESDKERSISQLNQDRHLAVSNIETLVENILKELIGEEEKSNKLASNPAKWKLSVMGYNRKRQEIINTAKEYGFNLDI